MKRYFSYILCCLLFACSPAEPKQGVQEEVVVAEPENQPEGTLFIIGGGKRPASLLDGITSRMSSEEALILVLPMASSEPDTSAFYGISQFAEMGMKNVKRWEITPNLNAGSKMDSLRMAEVIFICGGDQSRFMQSIINTPTKNVLEECYQAGAIIAGTSAGAAVMSEWMITGDQKREPEYESTYRRLMTDNAIYSKGLGLLKDAIVDQHFVERSRYNRALSCLHDWPEKKVYGIGESTALVVTKEGISVEGEGQVVVFEAGTSTSDSRGYISMENVRMDVLTEAATK